MSEKYWGPPSELMTEDEIHDFGVQVVIKDLQKEGHEIISVKTAIDQEPQIVAKIKTSLAFIIVRTAMYPNNGEITDLGLLSRVIAHAKQHKATSYFASVGIANSQGVDISDEVLSGTPMRGAGFYVNYRGLSILTSADNVKVFDDGKFIDLVPKELNKNAFSKAVESLLEDFGSLDDLPTELRNTIANIYYRFYVNIEYMNSGGNSKLLESYIPRSISTRDAFMNYTAFSAQTIAAFETAKSMIDPIRAARKSQPERKEIFDYMVQVALDSFKYDIDNAHEKTPFRRAIERKFKKPNEIPELYNKMRPLIRSFSNRNGSD